MPSKHACFNVKCLLSSEVSILDKGIQSRMQVAWTQWSFDDMLHVIVSFPDECWLAGTLLYSNFKWLLCFEQVFKNKCNHPPLAPRYQFNSLSQILSNTAIK